MSSCSSTSAPPTSHQAQVRDRCGQGRRTWRLSPYENKFNIIGAIEADATTPQPEVFLDATGDSDALTDRLVKLVRFDQPGGERPGLEVRLKLVSFVGRAGHVRIVGHSTRLYGYDAPKDRYVRLRAGA
jgi:hypothetical protein